MRLKQVKDRLASQQSWIAVLCLLVGMGAAAMVVHSTKPFVRTPTAVQKSVAHDVTASAPATTPADRARVAANFANLPLSFEPNLGQTDPQVKFLSKNTHYNLFLTSDEAVFTLPISKREKSSKRAGRPQLDGMTSAAVLRMKMLGANAAPQISGDTQVSGHSNYLIGRDRSQWVRDVDQYARVNYSEIYPGVDLTFYGQQRQLEFDFIVKPGARPETIALGVEGAKKIHTSKNGDLVLTSAAGDFLLHKPVAYQKQGDSRQPVDARFVIKGNEVAFALGEYDNTRELVIDPSVLYATYFGAGNEDDGYAIAVDSTGAAYITGQTSSTSFPVKGALPAPNGALQGTTDAFVAKFNADGSLGYSTYLGGTGVDSGNAIALDAAKNAYVVGTTTSTDFPAAGSAAQVSEGGGADAFVAVVSAAGNSLLYTSYVGGGLDEIGYGVAVDSTGIYICGSTASNDFPVVSALQSTFHGGTGTTPTDGFVTKIDFAGSGGFLFSSYLGGTAQDLATGIGMDAAHNIYVTGVTQSTDFPVFGAALQTSNKGQDDSFVTAIQANFVSYIYSTYLGGSSFDDANQIVVDSLGNAYIVGITSSSDFPTTSAGFQRTLGGSGASNAFVSILNPAGSALVSSTYLGGTGTDNGLNLALDASKHVYITGSTTSTNFPKQSQTQSTLSGGKDAFVTELK